MDNYNLYVNLISVGVFVLIAVVAVVLFTIIIKQSVQLIALGLHDKEIKKWYKDTQNIKKSVFGIILNIFLTVVVVAVACGIGYINIRKDSFSETIPTLRTVQSNSMSTKHRNNTYLEDNHLNNQFSTFDMILTYKIPPEEELKLYDIVLYEFNGNIIVHRIVKIYEKTAPEQVNVYILQGDSNANPDNLGVTYSQMRGIYRGEKIKHLGSFFNFTRTPIGIACILLFVVAVIGTPFLEKYYNKKKIARLNVLCNEKGYSDINEYIASEKEEV